MSELPRVLFCCFDVIPGPHARSRRLNEYLKAIGSRFQVVVLSNKTADLSHIERLHGARHMRVPTGSGDISSQARAFERAVRRQIESEEYAIIHFFDPFSGAAAAEMRPEGGYKLIYDACSFYSDDLPSEFTSVERLVARARRQELLCLMSADVVIVASQVASRAVHALGVPVDNVVLFRAPVERSVYPAHPPPTTGKPLHLLHLGDSAAWQEVDVLLKAVALVPEAHQVRLTVVIDRATDAGKALLEQAQTLGIAQRLELKDPVLHDDLHKVVCASDVALLTLADIPRNQRGPALARLGEFLAAGRPVIAARLPVVEELLPADASRLYQPGDPQSLAEAIIAVESSAELRQRMSQASFAAASTVDAASIRARFASQYALWLGLTEAVEGVSAAVETTQLQQGFNESTQLAKVDEVPQAAPGSAAADTGSAPRPAEDLGTDPGAHVLSMQSETGRLPGARVTAPVPVIAHQPAPVIPSSLAPEPVRPLELSGPVVPSALNRAVTISQDPQATVPVPVLSLRSPRPELPMPVSPDDEIAEIGADEVIAVGDGDLESEEVHDADELDAQPVGSGPVPVSSALDPWFAQAAHGYCPPESTHFVRHTPPTTMPGKDV